MTTRKQISSEIKKRTGLDVGLYGSPSIGCYHFYSDDPDTALKLARCYTMTVDVCYINDLTVKEWADNFDEFLEA